MAFLCFLFRCWQYYGRKKLNKIIKYTFIELFIKFLQLLYIYFVFQFILYFYHPPFPSMPDFPILSISKNLDFFFSYYFLLFKFSVSLTSLLLSLILFLISWVYSETLPSSWVELCSFTFHISSFREVYLIFSISPYVLLQLYLGNFEFSSSFRKIILSFLMVLYLQQKKCY